MIAEEKIPKAESSSVQSKNARLILAVASLEFAPTFCAIKIERAELPLSPKEFAKPSIRLTAVKEAIIGVSSKFTAP